jgi:outer membrane murein-binding lipoprotein Lpp
MEEPERIEFESHLEVCENCREEFRTSRQVFEQMNRLTAPEPSSNVRARFQGMLDAYTHAQEEKVDIWKGLMRKLSELWTFQPRVQLAYSVLLLVAGLISGYLLNNKTDNNASQMTELSSQVDEMRQMIMLAMVENPSASKRLEAVSYTEGISDLNDKVVTVLFKTLNEDPNVNVRLATLEALLKFSHSPEVRKGLVQSITAQESPLVISAMADAMVEIQEKSSVDSFRQLLNKDNLNISVKNKLEKSIHQLI